MILKAVQWNIGGGKVRKADGDPLEADAYVHDSIDSIIETLKKNSPDIVTIQEGHTCEAVNQAQLIADALGLKFVASDVYDKSHLEEGQGLNQAVISRFPIQKHSFDFFLNPKLKLTRPNGEEWSTHNKGVTNCLIELPEGVVVNVKTSHSVPCRKFGVNLLDKEMEFLRNDMQEKVKPEADIYLYQGDLNIDEFSLKNVFPNLFERGIGEVVLGEPTTPKGRKYDHVIFKGLKHIKSTVFKEVLNDHYPIYSEFDI